MTVKDVNISGGKKLPIKEFALQSMVEHPSIVMIAKRGCGKSWVCRAILNFFNEIPVGIIIAPTERMDPFYINFFPDAYIHYKYKSEVIERVLKRQEQIMDKQKEKKLKGKGVDPRGFILMDDCLSSKGTWMRDEHTLELLFNGRHYKLMYILTMQYPLGITPELRTNFDYIFLLADDMHSNMKRIHEHYAGQFPTFESFRSVFTQLTKNYGCMVISNRGARNSFLDKVFWYVAPDIKLNKIGCKQFQDFHTKNYDKEWKKRDRGFDIAEYCLQKKKDKSIVEINKVGPVNQRLLAGGGYGKFSSVN